MNNSFLLEIRQLVSEENIQFERKRNALDCIALYHVERNVLSCLELHTVHARREVMLLMADISVI